MATRTKKSKGGLLPAADEKRLATVAADLANTKKLDEQAVVVVGRKLIKLHKGLRSSRPPVPAKLRKTDLRVIVAALDLPAALGEAKTKTTGRSTGRRSSRPPSGTPG